jgi:hypothetical protein
LSRLCVHTHPDRIIHSMNGGRVLACIIPEGTAARAESISGSAPRRCHRVVAGKFIL